jgi:hypothetical protein
MVAGVLAALLLGACSSSGSRASQPDDEFLDKVEAVCGDAAKQIRRLDAGSAAALRDIMSHATDSLDSLKATQPLADDYDKYTTNMDDQLTQLQKIAAAAAAADTTTEQTAVDALNALRTDNARLVNTLGAVRCRGIVPANGLADFAGIASTSTSTSTSEPPATDPPVTDPPATDPSTEATLAPVATVLPGDVGADHVAPTGYKFVPYTSVDASGLYNNNAIGSRVTYYKGGLLQNQSDQSKSTVFVVKLSTDFTSADRSAYQYWERVENGTDVTTPGGLAVRQEFGSYTDSDCVVYVTGSTGVTICTPTGIDGLALMDAWVAANPL